MLLDFNDAPDGTEYQADVCIVGSGAAGLTVAAHLAGGLRVLLVEAGGKRPGAGEALAGEALDWAFNGFEQGRARAFGGSTKLWAGQCIRLDPLDFERRDWVPHSGWPITAAELDPYYDQAEAFLGIGGAVYDSRLWSRAGIGVPHFTGVAPKFTVYLPQPDFSRQFGRQLVQGGKPVDLLLNAAATGLEPGPDGGRMQALALAGSGGKRGRVSARAFVLCGGGIDNPRLLLASDGAMACGVGNAHGLVGRFFQDHPSGTTGVLATPVPDIVQAQFRMFRQAGRKVWPKLALTEAAQRDGRFLNANALMLYDYGEDSALTRVKAAVEAVKARNPRALAAAALRAVPHLPKLAAEAVHTAATGKAPMFKPSRLMLKAHVEQRPDPDNRVTLSAERDQFGMRLPRLAWRVHAEELRTMRGITVAVAEQFRRLGWGELAVEAWLDEGEAAARPHLEDTYHHHGTTRMAATPADGVTDPHCQVFGTENLFIAGSSVFPTSGYANPTLTIVALAIRLAGTVRQKLAGAAA